MAFCEDQSKVFGRDVASKKVHRTRESPASYQKFTLLMTTVKHNLVWRAQQVTIEGTPTACNRSAAI